MMEFVSHLVAERLPTEVSLFTVTESNEMTRPNIQIDDELREMTEEEYQWLLAPGWTEEGTNDLAD